ncbi:MAG: hypothetical protein GVY13_18475 [Alphaproteobacteria bacterium]|jgi:uncharacterized membrane-anchored protein|nr:hypothetical protein [Alphaproteobacteria bacterium]
MTTGTLIAILLVALVTAGIATPLLRWHYRKIHGHGLPRRPSWTYFAAVFAVTLAIAWLTVQLAG